MVDDKALISVVVPSFRHENFVERALQSVIDQTYRRLELVLIDDCSPDRTFDIAQDVLERERPRFERVVCIRNFVNRGAHFSLNRGCYLAKGKYVAFLNSDDEFYPERLKTISMAMEAEDSQIGFSFVEAIDQNSRVVKTGTFANQIAYLPAQYLGSLPSVSWSLLPFQIAISTGNIVISKELATRVGPFNDLKYCHDWDYLLRCTFFCEPTVVRTPLYGYRLHSENSFRALQTLAEVETRFVIEGHFKRVMTGRAPNRLAAAPQHWPTSFDALLSSSHLKHFFDRLYNPYKPYHRTVSMT